MAADDFTPSAREGAVALTYSPGDTAPTVVAKGRGLVAREIIERAHEAGVYVHESPELVSLLMQIDLDAHIPPQLYTVIAELLAWLYRVEAGGNPPPPKLDTFPAHIGDSHSPTS